MKIRKSNKLILVWLLLVVFVTPIVSKSAHVLQVDCCKVSCSHSEDDDNREPKHDNSTCSVCQFVLSYFTANDYYPPTLISVPLCAELYIVYNEKGYNSVSHTGYLRAPPSLV